MTTILITGGAGFIGSHLSESLVDIGYKVKILDNLSPQIHGPSARLPANLEGKVEFIHGDILDREKVEETVSGSDAVIHLAAETGVGQSMYEIARYTDININGTAILLEAMVSPKNKIKKAILASSRAVYGEGKYICADCGVTHVKQRTEEELRKKQWQTFCAKCGNIAEALPTDEGFSPIPISIYGVTKYTQEQLFDIVGKAYKIPTVVLRYFNVYGPRQSLKNPYTGIISIFSSMLLNGKQLPIYEDGMASRDFVYVGDVINATILALEKKEADYQVFNVGSGNGITVLKIANMLFDKLGGSLEPVIVGKYRVGDIRHCIADLAKIRGKLGYEPITSIDEGLTVFADWVKEQRDVVDLSEVASNELDDRKLLKKIE